MVAQSRNSPAVATPVERAHLDRPAVDLVEHEEVVVAVSVCDVRRREFRV